MKNPFSLLRATIFLCIASLYSHSQLLHAQPPGGTPPAPTAATPAIPIMYTNPLLASKAVRTPPPAAAAASTTKPVKAHWFNWSAISWNKKVTPISPAHSTASPAASASASAAPTLSPSVALPFEPTHLAAAGTGVMSDTAHDSALPHGYGCYDDEEGDDRLGELRATGGAGGGATASAAPYFTKISTEIAEKIICRNNTYGEGKLWPWEKCPAYQENLDAYMCIFGRTTGPRFLEKVLISGHDLLAHVAMLDTLIQNPNGRLWKIIGLPRWYGPLEKIDLTALELMTCNEYSRTIGFYQKAFNEQKGRKVLIAVLKKHFSRWSPMEFVKPFLEPSFSALSQKEKDALVLPFVHKLILYPRTSATPNNWAESDLYKECRMTYKRIFETLVVNGTPLNGEAILLAVLDENTAFSNWNPVSVLPDLLATTPSLRWDALGIKSGYGVEIFPEGTGCCCIQ